jgi:hypothetical protein
MTGDFQDLMGRNLNVKLHILIDKIWRSLEFNDCFTMDSKIKILNYILLSTGKSNV